MKYKAFSLAETLITLLMIAVLASLTLPAVINDWTEIKYNALYKKMHASILNGFNLMIVQDGMSGYNSTEDFVKNLDKYFKVAYTCGNDDLERCFTPKIRTKNGKIELSNLKKSSNLGKNWEIDTNVAGVVLSDGSSMLIAYNSYGCLSNASLNRDIIYSCVAIVFDLDNPSKGGKYVPYDEEKEKAGSDIGLFNATFAPKAQPPIEIADVTDPDPAAGNDNDVITAYDENGNEVTMTNTSDGKRGCKVNGRPCTLLEYLFYLLTLFIDLIT